MFQRALSGSGGSGNTYKAFLTSMQGVANIPIGFAPKSFIVAFPDYVTGTIAWFYDKDISETDMHIGGQSTDWYPIAISQRLQITSNGITITDSDTLNYQRSLYVIAIG